MHARRVLTDAEATTIASRSKTFPQLVTAGKRRQAEIYVLVHVRCGTTRGTAYLTVLQNALTGHLAVLESKALRTPLKLHMSIHKQK